MNDLWHDDLNGLASGWVDGMLRASWQGGTALALAWLLCRIGPRWPSAQRCWLWRLAILKLFLALLWTGPVELPILPPSLARAAVASAAPALRALPSTREEPSMRRHLNPGESFSRKPQHGQRGCPAALVWIWLAGAGAAAVLLLRDRVSIRQLLSSAVFETNPLITAACGRLAGGLGLTAIPRIRRVEAGDSPLLIGLFRPSILLPSHLLVDCPMEQIELMLAHELCHLKRRDLWWNWLPALAQMVFWFHPLVWLAGREWRLQQEVACDAVAVRATGTAPAEYGEMLLAVAARHRTLGGRWLAAAGMLDGYETLKRRLVAMKSLESTPRQRWLVVSVSLGLLALGGLIPWRVVAQNESPRARDTFSTSPPADARPDTAGTDPDSESLRRLRQLGRAMLLYAQDYDWTLPPMRDPKAAREGLYPYVRRDDSVLVDPHSNSLYLLNARLSGHRVNTRMSITYEKGPSSLNRIRVGRNGAGNTEGEGSLPLQSWPAPGVFTSTNLIRPDWAGHRWMIEHRTECIQEPDMVAAYEPGPAADGTRGVLCVDEQVKRVSESEWQRLKKVSGIP
jgi:beta-lactamase regulating signal transducer with metallopeptidase domain